MPTRISSTEIYIKERGGGNTTEKTERSFTPILLPQIYIKIIDSEIYLLSYSKKKSTSPISPLILPKKGHGEVFPSESHRPL